MHIPSAAEFRFAYIDRMQDLLNFCFAILNPITRPDPMNLPSKSFKDLLAQTVTVTRGHGGIIHRAVTFDSKQKASRIIRIDNGEVDTILRYADLWNDLQTSFRQRGENRLFKQRLKLDLGASFLFMINGPDAIPRCFQIISQQLCTLTASAGQIDILRLNGSHQFQHIARPCHRDVQSAIATIPINWTKIQE